jgi:hypothetical protein
MAVWIWTADCELWHSVISELAGFTASNHLNVYSEACITPYKTLRYRNPESHNTACLLFVLPHWESYLYLQGSLVWELPGVVENMCRLDGYFHIPPTHIVQTCWVVTSHGLLHICCVLANMSCEFQCLPSSLASFTTATNDTYVMQIYQKYLDYHVWRISFQFQGLVPLFAYC